MYFPDEVPYRRNSHADQLRELERVKGELERVNEELERVNGELEIEIEALERKKEKLERERDKEQKKLILIRVGAIAIIIVDIILFVQLFG